MFLIGRHDALSPVKTQTVALGVVLNSNGVNCWSPLAGDSPSWWKSRQLRRSQKFNHVQNVWVLVSGPHHLNDFCKSGSRLVRYFRILFLKEKVRKEQSPSTFMSIRRSSAASSCSASCDSSGAPGKQTIMTLMLSKLPWSEKYFLKPGWNWISFLWRLALWLNISQGDYSIYVIQECEAQCALEHSLFFRWNK